MTMSDSIDNTKTPTPQSSYMKLYNTWRSDPSKVNFNNLVNAFNPTINSEVAKYDGSSSILRSKGRLLTIKALKNYNPASNASINSWVVTNLKQLSRYNRNTKPIRVPEVTARQASELWTISNNLASDLGREPSLEELADETGWSVKRIKRIKETSVPTINSSVYDTPLSGASSASQPGVTESSQLPFAQEAVYMSLNDRDKLIYDLRTGSHGKKVESADSVASKLGITPAAVSQRANSIGQQILDIANRG
jgi:DNA-directed RNA polymerase specialized sigma subunit